MKNSNKWSFYFVSGGSSQIKKVNISGFVLVLILILSLTSLVGFANSIYFISRYTYARWGLYNETIENKSLLKKMVFLQKFSKEREKEINCFIEFEDDTRLKFGMNSISEDIRLAGVGGKPSLEEIVNASFEDPVVRKAGQLESNLEALSRQISIQDSTFSRMNYHIKMQHDKWAQRPSIWPVKGRITSSFGFRYHPFIGKMIFHEGLDIANARWTPIQATADGIVSKVGNRGNYGNSVMINHSGGSYKTVYAHLQQATVELGQVVKRGEIVGYLGSTGRSTGPHLHYEVRKFSKHVHPMKYILPTEIVVD